MSDAAADESDVVYEDLPEGEDQGEAEPTTEAARIIKKGIPSSCGVCCIGLLLFPTALIMLAWNERNSVCQSNAILKVEEESQTADCDDAKSMEGKFTFLSCPIKDTSLVPMSPHSSFNMPGLGEAIKIPAVAASQKVEMYQCVETKEERDRESVESEASLIETKRHDHNRSVPEEAASRRQAIMRKGHASAHAGKLAPEALDEVAQIKSSTARRRRTDPSDKIEVYTYKMQWTDVPYDSHTFHAEPQNIQNSGCPDFVVNGQVNHNPAVPDRGDGSPAELGKQTSYATNIFAGAFTFGEPGYIQRYSSNTPISLQPFASQFTVLSVETDNIITQFSTASLAVHSNSPNYLSSCNNERLGCVRVSYNRSDQSHLTVLGKSESSGVIKPYKIEPTLGCAGMDFLRMWPEEMSKEEAIASLKQEVKASTWVLRVVGLLMAWLAVYCVFDPIATATDFLGDLVDSIPVVGQYLTSALEGVVTMFLCMISCSFGLSCGLFVIAIVWVSMRPVVGGPLIGASLLLCVIACCAARQGDRNTKKMRWHKQAAYAEQQPFAPQADER